MAMIVTAACRWADVNAFETWPRYGIAYQALPLDLHGPDRLGIGRAVGIALRAEHAFAVAVEADPDDPVGHDGPLAGLELVRDDGADGDVGCVDRLDHDQRSRRHAGPHRAGEDRVGRGTRQPRNQHRDDQHQQDCGHDEPGDGLHQPSPRTSCGAMCRHRGSPNRPAPGGGPDQISCGPAGR